MRNLLSSVMASLALAILLAGSASADPLHYTQPHSLIGLRRVVAVPPWVESQRHLKNENFGASTIRRARTGERGAQRIERT